MTEDKLAAGFEVVEDELTGVDVLLTVDDGDVTCVVFDVVAGSVVERMEDEWNEVEFAEALLTTDDDVVTAAEVCVDDTDAEVVVGATVVVVWVD